jgi:hypothetical protein
VSIASYSDQLVSVQAAIATIEGSNQSYTLLGRTFSKADLKTLYDREKWLRTKVAREAAGGIRVQRVIPL